MRISDWSSDVCSSDLIAEKILAPDEHLDRDWRLDGTSGYAFMNEVSAVLHDREGGPALSALWSEFSGRSGDFEQAAERARRRIPQELLAADFEACQPRLHSLAKQIGIASRRARERKSG